MKTIRSGILYATILFTTLLVGISVTQQATGYEAHTSSFSAAAVTYICSNGTLPSGYVVVSSGTDYRCPGLGNYRWTIQPASDGIVACLGSSYPNPYFITSETSNAYQCTNGGFLGAMTLNLPTDGTVACTNGVLWSPWVITANSRPYQCNGYGAITLSQPAEGLRICSNSVIPSGWSVGAATQFYLCQPYLAEYMHQLTASTPRYLTPIYHRDGKNAVTVPSRSDGT